MGWVGGYLGVGDGGSKRGGSKHVGGKRGSGKRCSGFTRRRLHLRGLRGGERARQRRRHESGCDFPLQLRKRWRQALLLHARRRQKRSLNCKYSPAFAENTMN